MRSRFPKIFSGSGSVSYGDIMKRDVIRVASAGTLTLPAPVRKLVHRTVKVANDTAGYVTLFCLDSFLNGISSVVIPPYEACDLRVIVTGTSWSDFYWCATGGNLAMDAVKSWTPTLTWTTGTPTTTGGAAVSPVGEYIIKNGTCYGNFYVSWTDGNGATALTATLPVLPAEIRADIPCPCSQLVDTTYSIPLAYIDAGDATGANRLLKFYGLSACTDAKAGHVRVSFCYPVGFASTWSSAANAVIETVGTGPVGIPEIDSASTYSWVHTFGTADPATMNIANWEHIAGLCSIFAGDWSSADSNACSSFKVEPPSCPPDTDMYYAAQGIESRNDSPTITDMEAYVDGANATAENRCYTASTFTAPTDGQAVKLMAFGLNEIVGWSSWTPTITYTTADIDSPTTVSRYTVEDGICYFSFCLTDTDGEGCTGVEFTLPVDPAHGSAVISCMGHQTVNTTVSNPAPYIDAVQESASDRTVKFSNLSTFTDGVAAKLYVTGWYPVGG